MVSTQEIESVAESLAGVVEFTAFTIRTATETIAVSVSNGKMSVSISHRQTHARAKLSDTRKRKVRKLFPMCVYCQKKPSNTVDHVFPRSRGGSNNEANLVGCCLKCNEFKGDRTPKEAGMKIHYPVGLVKTFKL